MSRISAVRSQKLARQGSPHRGDVHNSIRVPRAKVFHDNIGLQGRWGKPLVVDCVGKIIECVLVCVCAFRYVSITCSFLRSSCVIHVVSRTPCRWPRKRTLMLGDLASSVRLFCCATLKARRLDQEKKSFRNRDSRRNPLI